MPTYTLLRAFKTLSHQLQLYRFPECDDAEALEACLHVRARINYLRSDAELNASCDQESLRQCQEEFQFLVLVLEQLRSFVVLTRPLQPQETISAMSALQFLARRLTVPYDQWGQNQCDTLDLGMLLVERE